MHIGAVVCEIWIENKRVQNLQFRGDCDHPSPEKVVFTIDAKIGNTIIVLPLDNPLYALEKTPCTHVCAVPLSSRIDNSWAVKMFYKSNCALAIRRQLERCQAADFRIMVFEILIGLRMEASTTNVVRKLVLLRCKSTQLAVQLHHEGKLCSTCLVVN